MSSSRRKPFRPSKSLERVHLLGAGGAGMSALGEVLLDLGFAVSGSDLKVSPATEALVSRGAEIAVGHSSDRGEGADLLVFSSAVARDNPELAAARGKIPVWHRSELLARLMEGKKSLAVAGSHGKTSTSALIVWILEQAGRRPGFALGGRMIGLERGGRWGEGEWFVAEADESDASFHRVRPDWEVVTALSLDHVSRYPDRDALRASFRTFISNLRPGGGLSAWSGAGEIESLHAGRGPFISYGLGAGAALRGGAVAFSGGSAEFSVYRDGRKLGRVNLPRPGLHEIVNSLGALSFVLETGVSFRECVRALASWPGARRRMEKRGSVGGAEVYEDYSHHPAEIRVALHALRSLRPRRLWCVFQPHRFSRLAHLHRQISLALLAADRLILADLYPAFEDPVPGVDSGLLLRDLHSLGAPDVSLLDPARALEEIRSKILPGDIVVVMGAGDIGELAGNLVIKQK